MLYNAIMPTSRTEADAATLRAALGALPEPVARPFLVLLSGLPGTGKSYFARALATQVPAVILESDALRKALVGQPTYAPPESGRLFLALRRLVGELLGEGIPAIVDATNITERNRRDFYRVAEGQGARLLIVQTVAPPHVVKERLAARQANPDEKSDATWAVYERMAAEANCIRRAYYHVDTTQDITPVIMRIAQELTGSATPTQAR